MQIATESSASSAETTAQAEFMQCPPVLAARRTRRRLPTLEAEARDDKQDTQDQRVAAQEPDQTDQARIRCGGQQEAQGDRQRAGQAEQPHIRERSAKLERCDDLKN